MAQKTCTLEHLLANQFLLPVAESHIKFERMKLRSKDSDEDDKADARFNISAWKSIIEDLKAKF